MLSIYVLKLLNPKQSNRRPAVHSDISPTYDFQNLIYWAVFYMMRSLERCGLLSRLFFFRPVADVHKAPKVLVRGDFQGDQKTWVKSRLMSIKSCPKILSLEKWKILKTFAKKFGNLAWNSCHRLLKVTKSGHTGDFGNLVSWREIQWKSGFQFD